MRVEEFKTNISLMRPGVIMGEQAHPKESKGSCSKTPLVSQHVFPDFI
jgi:hypothetical protein